MINKSSVSSYRKYLTDRIQELTETHSRYKEVEASEENSEIRKVGLNSSAACIWDMKAMAEQMLLCFDMEFGSTEKPYKIVKFHVYETSAPEITILDKGGNSVTFEMQRIKDETPLATFERLLERCDKFYECSLLDEEITDLIEQKA